jgi:RND family efflux transporter MFP subunit
MEPAIAMRWVFNVVLPALLTFILAGCGGEEAPKASDVRPVRSVVVEPKPIDDDRQAVGEIRARYESDLSFRVSGKVVSRPVDVGARVTKGEILARLDDQDYRNRLKSAEADVTSAAAVLSEAKASEERLKQLLGTGATTRANYDVALKNLLSSEAKLNSSNAALELAKDQLNYAELRADFNGLVTAVGAEVGQVVNVGQMIVKVADPSERDAVFAIAETAFRVRPKDERPEVTVSLLSNPAIKADGAVREISPVADPVTRTFQVKVGLRSPPDQMRFGSSVVGRLKILSAPVIVLPGSALFEKAGKPAVWVYRSDSMTVGLKPVTIDRYETDRVVISDGLVKGDVVVTAGVNRLREGQKVRLAGTTP